MTQEQAQWLDDCLSYKQRLCKAVHLVAGLNVAGWYCECKEESMYMRVSLLAPDGTALAEAAIQSDGQITLEEFRRLAMDKILDAASEAAVKVLA